MLSPTHPEFRYEPASKLVSSCLKIIQDDSSREINDLPNNLTEPIELTPKYLYSDFFKAEVYKVLFRYMDP